MRIATGLHELAKRGVEALQDATPKDTGKTAESWDYKIDATDKGITIVWTNSNVNDGANIAMLIQYGHGTGSGAYIEGVDYINPALKPIFQEIADNAWVEVTGNAYY